MVMISQLYDYGGDVPVTGQVRTAMRDSDLAIGFHNTARTSTAARGGLVVDGVTLANR
jgi:hypothetical protein